ncbi:MAG TPA: TlpA disulfide reductase family protein [Candidatus Sulfotelmatobacter sp.]|nr:TlpA disulfide reductase family protein [Candidatus Sulfotelmatobacter sp.]
MEKLARYHVLVAGMLSPILAVLLSAFVNKVLMRWSGDPQRNWLLRLIVSTLVMVAPFAVTLVLAMKDRHRSALLLSGKIGVTIAILSLGLIAKPVSDGLTRSKQERNKLMRDVAAPLFETTDVFGNRQRLADHKGEVVLVNIWATWCAPCRAEMPVLDRLYRERKDRGFVVLGMSDESIASQKRYLKEVSVSYPLLALTRDVPSLYRDIARYPEMFLIDRKGRLQPAPGAGQPFQKLEADVDALLARNSQ